MSIHLHPSPDPFGNALTEEVMRHFTHPDPLNPLHHLYRFPDGTMLAANSYVAVQFSKGHVMASEFPLIPTQLYAELSKLPWEWAERFKCPDRDSTIGWRSLDLCRSALYRYSLKPVWEYLTDGQWQLRGTPAVRIDENPMISLSILQLVGRLPRVEILCGVSRRDQSVVFRFNGGVGVLVNHNLPGPPNFRLLSPQKDFFGDRKPVNPLPKWIPEHRPPGLANWPPPEPVD